MSIPSKVRFSINIQKTDQDVNTTALERSVNICDQMKKRKGSDFLMQIVLKGLTDFGNFSTRCPIKVVSLLVTPVLWKRIKDLFNFRAIIISRIFQLTQTFCRNFFEFTKELAM